MPAFLNRLAQLLPKGGYAMPPPIQNPNQGAQSPLSSMPIPGQSPLLALAGSQDATGSDTPTTTPYNTPILSQLQSLLQHPPNPADYQPSKTRRILGALAGMGAGASPVGIAGGTPIGFKFNPEAALGAQQAVTDEPFNKAMGRYSTQAKLLEPAAGIEERNLTNQRMIQQSKVSTDLKQQQIDINAKKEQDIFNTKQAELQAKVDKAAKDLEEKQKEFAGRQTNFQDQLELRRAQMDLTDATHKLQIEQKDRALDEQRRLHDIEKSNWDRQREQQDQRLQQLETAAKNKPSTPGETDTTKKDIYEGGIDLPVIGHVGGHKVGTQTNTVKKPYTPMSTQQPGIVRMKGPDGNIYNIPTDKVEHAKQNRMVVVQ